MPRFRYVDLFAGIGGFHAALSAAGGECVYAVEIDKAAASVYQRNWGINPLGDITVDVTDDVMKVPEHEVLVGGFPCQPFSKSGAQRGMAEARGTLFWNIARIIEVRRPPLVLLENVRNLVGPRHEDDYDAILETLKEFGYRVSEEASVFSPHLLPRSMGGRPQVRERVFIAATLDPSGIGSRSVEPVVRPKPLEGWDPARWNIGRDLPLQRGRSPRELALSDDELAWIDAWDAFVVRMREARKGLPLPSFPLWADSWIPSNELAIPQGTPAWKEAFFRKNAAFYDEYAKIIDLWMNEYDVKAFPPSRRKLEWQAQDTKTLWDCVMHLRPSGIRAKRPTYLPALVAITQTSIIGKRRRRISPREAARLQGLPDWFDFGDQAMSATYKQLGNGVSIGAIWYVLRKQIERDADLLSVTYPSLLGLLELPEDPDPLLEALGAKTKS